MAVKPDAVVETTLGPVRGAEDHGTLVFRGIPYGASTAGPRRFRAPEPPARWDGIRDALEFGHATPQERPLVDVAGADHPDVPRPQPVPQDEDCLVLNVWTPAVDDGRKRPVMVWLHGGGFNSGVGATAATNGAALVNRGDVVVVTLNHRLNLFGFLHLEDIGGADFEGSGVAGVLDIVLALQWVRENIEAFGGDPGNVTLFGVSGGGRKITVLLGMPEAKGLFHRGIIQSGAHPRGVPRERANEFAEQLLVHMGLGSSDLAKLQQMPVKQLQDSVYGFIDESTRQGGAWSRGLLSPVVDGVHLPGHPFDPAAAPSAAAVPIMIGTTRHEMATFLARKPEWAEIDEQGLVDNVRRVLGDRTEEVIEVTRKNRPGSTPYDLLVALASEDRRQLSLQVAERQAAGGSAPVYFYQFAWETDYANGLMRAGHSLDTPLVFDNADGRPTTGSSPARYDMAALMSETWLAFARNGDPNHDGLPHWPTFDADARQTMVLDLPPHAEADPDQPERLAWADITVHLPFEGPAFVGSFSD
ncbi:MAG: carboxylesterase family protein [Dehalococcoidia bacterium]|nr:carboxylesterase family protein [Dehalococcoidia bacterium]